MICEESKQLMAAGWSGELNVSGRAKIEAHLETCEECRAEAALFGGLWERMGSLPVPEPSSSLRVRWESTLESLSGNGQVSVPKKDGVVWWPVWWPKSPAWQVAIAACAMVLGVFAGSFLQRTGSDKNEIADLRKQVTDTREMVALSLLHENTASERLKGVDYSGRMARLEPDVVSALVQAVSADPNVNVRLAAIDALMRAAGDSRVRNSLTKSMETQESPMVQAALIDYAIEAHDLQAATPLRKLLANPDLNPLVRQRATHALQVLSQ